MLTSPFFRRLFVPYLLLIVAAVGVVGFVGAQRLHTSYVERTRRAMSDETLLLARALAGDLRADRAAELNAQVRELGRMLGRRITVVAADGTVLADNEADPQRMENHRLRPEILTAASRDEGESLRPSDTVHLNLMYFARRVQGADGQPYYLRVAVHLKDLESHLRAFYTGIALAAVLAIGGAALICYLFARRLARPLVELTGFADALRQGDLAHRTLLHAPGEIGRLAAALNAMADSLSALITQTGRDKSQLLAVLSSMSEGVIATDNQQRIVLSNAAAAELLALSPAEPQGQVLWELLRSQPILEAANAALADGRRRDVQVGPIAGRHLDVALCKFGPAPGALPSAMPPEGIVLVIHDATESVRFQELRKEFVANVSHELRTPLTAIKGFTETLRDGALHDPLLAPKYLATIEKHADQLGNLVSDLLELSRLESLPGLPRLVPVDMGQVVQKAADLLRPAADKKRHTLTVELIQPLPPIDGNPDYLERAVTNLLDNAIKYTPEGGRIAVFARVEDAALAVEVTDTGIGIPAADLPRIFERFYRVDRSRSRDMGGTGLGLSIVKHIAQAHRGSVEVHSTPGQGTTFCLKIPL